MARNPKNLAIKNIASTSITDLGYTVPESTVTSPNLVITNNSSAILSISVYINDGTTDYLMVNRKVPAGIGKTWRVIEVSDQKLNVGYSIKTECDSVSSYTAFLSGSEISDS